MRKPPRSSKEIVRRTGPLRISKLSVKPSREVTNRRGSVVECGDWSPLFRPSRLVGQSIPPPFTARFDRLQSCTTATSRRTPKRWRAGGIPPWLITAPTTRGGTDPLVVQPFGVVCLRLEW